MIVNVGVKDTQSGDFLTQAEADKLYIKQTVQVALKSDLQDVLESAKSYTTQAIYGAIYANY